MPEATSYQELTRAAFTSPSTADEATRSIDLVIATDAPVDGLVLRCTAEAVEYGPAPVPVLLDHVNSVQRMGGRITAVRFENGQIIGRATFMDAPAADDGWALARSGCAVSVGASFNSDSLTSSRGSDVDVVTKWRLRHAALVPQGADVTCYSRSKNTADHPDMTLDTKAAGDDPVATDISTAAPDSARSEAPAPASADTAELKRTAAELRRENEILRTCTIAKLPELADEFIRSGLTSEQVSRKVVERLAAAEPAKGAGSPANVRVTRDEGDTLMRGIGEYLTWRTRSHEKPTDLARQYRGMTVRELGRAYLESRGVNTMGMGINELIERAFHSTGDFPLLFADVAQKNLIAGYEEEPQTWRPLARQQNLPDFKLSRDLQIQGRIIPQELPEGGEYQLATLIEAQATWNLVTYARKLLVGRTALINDDLGALERAPVVLGRGFRLHESDLVWDLITRGANGAPAGIDNVALFDAAHNNTGTGVINVANVAALDLAMGLQRDIAGNDLNLEPVYMLVPRGLKVTGQQFLDTTNHQPTTKQGNDAVNPFAGNLQLIVENRLHRDSAAQWYLAASPSRIEMIKFGYLAGEEGPTITPVEKRDPDGIELLARYDFGCTVSDFRGFARSTGA